MLRNGTHWDTLGGNHHNLGRLLRPLMCAFAFHKWAFSVCPIYIVSGTHTPKVMSVGMRLFADADTYPLGHTGDTLGHTDTQTVRMNKKKAAIL